MSRFYQDAAFLSGRSTPEWPLFALEPLKAPPPRIGAFSAFVMSAEAFETTPPEPTWFSEAFDNPNHRHPFPFLTLGVDVYLS